MRDQLIFAVAPYIVAFAFLPVCAVRYLLWRARPHRQAPARPRALTPALVAGQLALVVIALGHLLAFAFPDSLLNWNRQIGRLILLEMSGAIAAVVAITGIGLSLIRAARTDDRAYSPVDVVAGALLLTAMLSGLGVAVLYRWASEWSEVTLLPYLRSLAVFDPSISLVTYLPPLVKLHVASAFALVAVLPFTAAALAVMVGINDLARRGLAPIGPRAAAARAGVGARAAAAIVLLRTRVLRNSAEEN